MKKIIGIVFILVMLVLVRVWRGDASMIEKVVTNNNISLWTQSYGNSKNTPIILICGAGAPAVFWSESFIQKLVDAGYRVIRFDHRDTGLSSAVDYDTNPYTVLDLKDDVLRILDVYGIPKAHVLGHSMGGMIAQLLAIYSPERILSMHSLSVGTVGGIGVPSKEIMDILLENKPTQNFEESLPGYMNSWRILNGDFELDEKMAREYTRDFYVRSNHPVGVAWNHIKAQEKFSDLREQLATLAVPAFFIHGDKDPLIPVQAAIATAQAVPHSKMLVIPGMGHMMFNQELEDTIVRLVLKNLKGAL